MKQFICAVLSIFLLFGVCLADENPAPKDQREKESYSLGFQFGKSMKAQGVDIDLDIYTSAIRDALSGHKPRMTPNEIRATIQGLQQRLALARHETEKILAEKNLAEGKAFLEENGKKQGVKTLPSGLQYKIISQGSGKTPKKEDTVTVQYRGTLIDGKEFDSSIARGQPASFKVNGVIPGWTEALQLMKEGAKWQLFIPPDLAYGERGMPPRIPSQSTLVFEIELISVK